VTAVASRTEAPLPFDWNRDRVDPAAGTARIGLGIAGPYQRRSPFDLKAFRESQFSPIQTESLIELADWVVKAQSKDRLPRNCCFAMKIVVSDKKNKIK